MSTFGWDYDNVEDRSALPWVSDFTVTGTIAGPGCPGVTPPVEEPSFPGTLFKGFEREGINELLTYTQPLRDRFHVDAGAGPQAITIRYSEDIDPATFKVQPGWARQLFDPRPGHEETVELPLKHARNRFYLEVHPVKARAPRKSTDQHHSYKDRDVFEIRVDGLEPGSQGQGAAQRSGTPAR